MADLQSIQTRLDRSVRTIAEKMDIDLKPPPVPSADFQLLHKLAFQLETIVSRLEQQRHVDADPIAHAIAVPPEPTARRPRRPSAGA